MNEPVCLIENSNSGELRTNQKALEILSSINQPVVVVSIVGLYRTGKSYLMNKLAGKMKGFSLGSTVQSHTKGIWMWCVPHPKKRDHTLVLLDTEGLGDIEKGDQKNDCWIFCLAVLLGSTFVYNSMGTIDQTALDRLHYVTELTERIKVKTGSEDDSSDFSRFFPAFVWTVRDFTLQLEVDGQPITEDQYLDNALQLKKGFSPKIQQYNFPRECIRNFFPSRKCFIFDRPTNREQLHKLEQLPENKLEPTFVVQTQKFCDYVFSNSQTKTVQGGHIVNGRMLGNLTTTYVDSIQSGAIPCLENAVLALAQIENSAAVEQAVAYYKEAMEKSVALPTETVKELSEIHALTEKEAIEVFMKRSFKDEEGEFQALMTKNITSCYEQFCQKNEQTSDHHCKAILLDLFSTLEKDISDGLYSQPGGYKQFIKIQGDLVEKYKAIPGKGVKAEAVLQEFLKLKENVAESILQADQSLSEKEKEIEAEKAKAEAAAMEVKVMEEQQKAMEQMIEDQQRTYTENMHQLEKKMEEERKKLIEEQNKALDQKLKEQEDLLQKGFQEKAERLTREIDELRRERSQPRSAGPFDILGGVLSAVLPAVVKKFLRF